MHELKPFLRLYRKQWRQLALGLLLSITTLAASVGLLSISGWFLSATAVAGLVIARSADFNYLMPAGAVRGLSVIRTVSRWAERVVSHDATFRLLATLRSWFFLKLASVPSQQRQTVRSGDLLNRMVADVDALDHVYLRLVTPVVGAIATTVGCSVLIAIIAPTAGLVIGLVMTTLLIVLPMLFYRLGKTPGEQIADRGLQLRQHLLDYFVGHNELRIFAAVDNQKKTVTQQQSALISSQRNAANISAIAQGLVVLFNGWLLLAVIVVGYHSLAADSNVGPLLALIAFASMAGFESIAPLAGAFQHLGQTKIAAKRLNQVVEHTPASPGKETVEQFDSLSLNQLSFAYPSSTIPVLKAVNLHINAGEKVALVGQTGCGKSTLLQLLTRELSANPMTIQVNKTDLSQFSERTIQQLFCVVSQRVHIFNDTLANNLKLAKPNATNNELVEVLEKVQLSGLLTGSGLDQWLGDGGRVLSGGERRRIGIARALLHPAPVLLLDEPTEGLDDATEASIIELLVGTSSERTLIYVTHKPAALASMDRCYRLEDGVVTQH